jgi:hypothetical protein
MTQTEIMDQLVEIRLPRPDCFLVIRETLTRIGLIDDAHSTLYQQCHILHKQGRYFITHYKELFALDGQPSDFDVLDAQRRNTIVMLLSNWKLVDVVSPIDAFSMGCVRLSDLKVVAFHEKAQWSFVTKYHLGKK